VGKNWYLQSGPGGGVTTPIPTLNETALALLLGASALAVHRRGR
jgi:hypothetical protein